MVAGYTSPETDSLQCNLPPKSSQFGTSWPTYVDSNEPTSALVTVHLHCGQLRGLCERDIGLKNRR